MWMQFNCFTVPAFQSAFLACVIIALINRLAPFLVFITRTCNFILMRFINVICKPFYLTKNNTFRRSWVCFFRTCCRAVFSNSAALYVFRHFTFTNWACRFYRGAFFAQLIKEINISRADTAHSARPTDFMSIRLRAGSASNAGFILSRFAHYGYLRSWFTAIRARYNRIGLTGRTHAENTAVFFADDTQVFSHIAIIPQLPDLKGIIL